MAVAERTAKVVWEGETRTGSGRLEPGSALFAAPVSLPARLESDSASTSPEELIAAAQAASYAMTLANTLHSNGHQPDHLEVTAVCRLGRTQDGLRIQEIEVRAHAWDQRLPQDVFEDLARKAEERCPVANAFGESVSLTLLAEVNPASVTPAG